MQTTYVIFNPASGSYSPRRADRVLAVLRSAGFIPEPLTPSGEPEAVAAVRAICDSGRQPLIIAAGGDGTVNTVINGMTRQSATLGFIPLGTANVLARELGIRSLESAVQRLVSGERRLFSVGEVISGCDVKRFLLMAGVGIDGAIVAGVRAEEKRRLGKLAYLLSAMRELKNWDRSILTISDGEHSMSCHSVVIANAAHYGGPYMLAPRASLFSRHLEIVPLTFPTARNFVQFGISLLMGKSAESPAWQLRNGQLTVTGTKAVQLDGDRHGAAPVIIRLVEDFNSILC